jgi:hypothetical protein
LCEFFKIARVFSELQSGKKCAQTFVK